MKKNKIDGLLNRNNKTIILNKNKKRKASSTNWLNRQLNDVYVNSAKEQGYYSRSSYKLIEINNKFNILNPGDTVLDLGAAPGGWSQVASKIVKEHGKIIAIDLLETKPLNNNVITIKGDFLNEKIINQILNNINNKANVILSDMAPNTTGNKDIDHLRIINLIEAVINLSIKILKKEGSLVVKVFQGGLVDNLLKEVKIHFKNVKHFKPLASRKESKEIYLVATGFKNY